MIKQKRGIPSLDGLRAISVLLVIFYHSRYLWVGRSEYFFYPLREGGLGVTVFFVISGFLITHLLLKGLAKTGKISLPDFYIRRAFRILPPFYVFLAVVGIRSLLHVESVDSGSFLSAATYTWNYNVHATGDVLTHLWSLSLEEQFYLLWPLCLVFFSKQTNLKLAIVIVALSPILRVVTYFLAPTYRGHIGMMLHTGVDTIMMGCILALALDLGVCEKIILTIRTSNLAASAAVLCLLLSGYLDLRLRGAWTLAAGKSLEGICCLVIVLYSTSNAKNPLGLLLNHPVMRHLGMISYGIYLWQQMFISHGPIREFPLNCLCILICAELSYFLIEKPSYFFRDRVLDHLKLAPEV